MPLKFNQHLTGILTLSLLHDFLFKYSLSLCSIYGEVVVQPNIVEGIKQDGSFYQHGQQVLWSSITHLR